MSPLRDSCYSGSNGPADFRDRGAPEAARVARPPAGPDAGARAHDGSRPHRRLAPAALRAPHADDRGPLVGILSIGGFAYSYIWATTPAVPTRGDVIAAAVDARTEKTIPDATLEVFTLKDALVT